MNIFVNKILVNDGDLVKPNQPILMLDSTEPLRRLLNAQRQQAAESIASEKLDAAYVDAVILAPMNALLSMHSKSAETCLDVERVVTNATVLGRDNAADLQIATATTQSYNAKAAEDSQELNNKHASIQADRDKIKARLEALKLIIDELNQEIASYTVRSARSGRIAIHTFGGLFVERGDALFSVV